MTKTDLETRVQAELTLVKDLITHKGRLYSGPSFDVFEPIRTVANLQGVPVIQAYINLVSKHISTFFLKQAHLNKKDFLSLTEDIIAYFTLIRVVYNAAEDPYVEKCCKPDTKL